MSGYNFAQNIIGINKGANDIHELEVDVAKLSASVLSIEENVESITPQDVPVIVNTDYVTETGLQFQCRQIKDLVFISGRFTVSTEKPAGQQYVLFSGLPIPAPSLIASVYGMNYTELLINSGGYLTSNQKVPTGSYNIFCSYVCQLPS